MAGRAGGSNLGGEGDLDRRGQSGLENQGLGVGGADELACTAGTPAGGGLTTGGGDAAVLAGAGTSARLGSGAPAADGGTLTGGSSATGAGHDDLTGGPGAGAAGQTATPPG